MPDLFTYTIPVDDGAAPNPFGGICTLVICKPAIRRTACVGDWIAGFGSKNAPSGNLSGKLVYAIRVTEVCSLKEYDRRAPKEWPWKIPDLKSEDISRRLGDCIYDYSSSQPKLRPGVHTQANRKIDLKGNNALISNHFYYFGSSAIELPAHLAPILHQSQGHKRQSDAPYLNEFVKWIESLRLESGKIYGPPGFDIDWSKSDLRSCRMRMEDDEKDKETN